MPRITRSSMVLVRCPCGWSYALPYSAPRPHNRSVFSRISPLNDSSAHSRSRRNRCANVRRAGAVGGVIAEDVGQAPEGDGKSAQGQGLLDIVAEGGHVGQGEGRSDGEGGPGGLAQDAAQPQAELLGAARVLEEIAFGEGA